MFKDDEESIEYLVAYVNSMNDNRVDYYVEPMSNAELTEAIKQLEEKLDTKTVAIFTYKGTVESVNALPGTAEVGDCYNVEDTGANYAYNGTEWDKLSETLDLSGYATITQLNAEVAARQQALADKADKADVYTKQEADENLANKIEKYAQLPEDLELGTIVQYIGESTNAYKKGYFCKYIGQPGIQFTKTQNEGAAECTTEVTVSLENFKAYLQTLCEGRPFTAEEVTHGQIGYHNMTDRYSFSGATDDGNFFAISVLISDLTAAGFVFEPALGPGQGIKFTCNLTNNTWKQINVQPQTDISAKADRTDIVDLQNKLNTNNGNITAITSRLDVLETRIADINKVNIEPVAAETAVNESDNTKDYVIQGNITNQSAITGKSVTIKDTNVTQAVVNINAGDVDVKNTDISGAYDKDTQGNSVMNVHSDGYVTIKDCTISATGYNALEIGLTTGLAKNVLIDNVKFTGKFTNNAISIYQTADDAVITISNCEFEDVSNILRLSNVTGAKATLNMINCKCNKWETGNYAGARLLQHYTSKNAAEVETNNLFANMTINIQNLVKPDGTTLQPVDPALICGSGNNQIIYLYADKVGLIGYDANRYPTINIL